MFPVPSTLHSFVPRRRRLDTAARVLAALLLLLQAVTGVVLPVLDAAGPHGGAVVAHWDGESERHCPPQHAEGDCLVVKSLTASALPPSVRPLLVAATSVGDEGGPTGDGVARRSTDRRIPPATGPPQA